MECVVAGVDLTTSSGSVHKTRKRGISAILADSTIIQPSKRASKEQALSNLRGSSNTGAPRGAAKRAGIASAMARSPQTVPLDTRELEDGKENRSSLYQIVRHNTVAYNNAKKAIQRHTEMNTTMDIKKAIAIQVLVTAIDKWSNSIFEAAKIASDVTGYNAETIPAA